MMIGGALVNAFAFTGSSYMFHALEKKHVDSERVRHDKAVEQMQKAQIEWSKKRQERIDLINERLMKEKQAEKRFDDLDVAMKQYYIVTGVQLPELPPEPKLSDFYKPSDDQHYRELVFITVGMTAIAGGLYLYEK